MLTAFSSLVVESKIYNFKTEKNKQFLLYNKSFCYLLKSIIWESFCLLSLLTFTKQRDSLTH